MKSAIDTALDKVYEIDKQKMLGFLLELPEQCKNAFSLDTLDLNKKRTKRFNSIVFCGIGGSAIGVDLLNSFIRNTITIPSIVNRDYDLPDFVNTSTLCVLCSYSGNTEEIIANFHQAREKNATIVILTSQGKLLILAKEHEVSYITLPLGLQPRMSVGYTFFSVLSILKKYELVSVSEDVLEETWATLVFLRDKLIGPHVSIDHNLAKRTAEKILGKFPIIYASNKEAAPVLKRWKAQFAENSKVLSSIYTFPEVSHNEIVAWQHPRISKDLFIVLLLKMNNYHERIKMQMNIVQQILEHDNVAVIEIHAYGKCFLSEIFSLIYIGDFISYYMSLLYEVDPTPIKYTDIIKKELSKN